MIEKYYEALQKRENLRENLVGLRAQIKDEAAKEQFVSMIGDGGLLLELLEEEDPKVRKNVAMILGELEWMGAADALVTAYEREQTLFVKSTYLKALAYLDITAYQERFKTRMEELLSYTPISFNVTSVRACPVSSSISCGFLNPVKVWSVLSSAFSNSLPSARTSSSICFFSSAAGV